MIKNVFNALQRLRWEKPEAGHDQPELQQLLVPQRRAGRTGPFSQVILINLEGSGRTDLSKALRLTK
jgi:hypothetical protein